MKQEMKANKFDIGEKDSATKGFMSNTKQIKITHQK